MTPLKGVNIKTLMRFESQATTPSTTSGEYVLYVNGSNQLVYDNGSSSSVLGTAGAVSNFSLNDAYDDGSTLTVDTSAVVFNGSLAGDIVTINNSGAGAGLGFAVAGGGNDIEGTSTTWYVTAAGAAVFTGITIADDNDIVFGTDSDITMEYDEDGNNELLITGATGISGNVNLRSTSTFTQAGNAGSTVFTITAGDVVFSDASLSITDADNAETVTVINNTATTIGNASSAAVVQIESTSLTTGALLNLQLTEGTLNGGWYLRAWDATGGAAVFSVAEDGATTITGNAAGTDALTVTAGDLFLNDTDGTVMESEDGTTTMLTVDNKLGVIASDSAVVLIDAGGAVASGGNLLRVAPTGTPNAGAIAIEYVGSGKTCQAVYVDGDPTGVDLMHINCGGALTNGFAVLGITNDGNLAAGGALINLTLGGTPNADARVFEIDGQKDAIAVYIDSDAATDSAVQIRGQGAIANNKAMLEIVNTGTPANAGSNFFRIDASGCTATNKPIMAEFVGTGKDVSGLYIDADNTTTHGVSISGTGALNAGRMLLVDNDGTPAANTDAVAEIKFTGTATNNPVVLNVNNGTADAAPLLVTSNVASATRAVATMIQDSTTGAQVVLTLQQDDVDEDFIAFNSTAGSGASVDLTNTTPATVVGSVLVSAVDGTKYRIPLYAAAGWS